MVKRRNRMEKTIVILALLFLAVSCGSKSAQNGSSSGSVSEGTDIAIGSCSVRFLANDSEETSVLKGHLVRKECGI